MNRMTKAANVVGLTALVAAAILAGCGGGDDSVPSAAPAVPEGGPLAADTPQAKAYNDAGAAFAAGSANPIHQWAYRVWCQTGYRTAPKTGVDGIDALVDPSVDLVTPKGFTSQAESATPMPAGGVRFLDNAWYFGTDGTGMVLVQTATGNLLMFDALTSAADMDSQVLAQMRTLGLDPARITHIFVGHEHGDHYGGVNRIIRDFAPKAKVVASVPASAAIATARQTAQTATYTGTADEQAKAKADRLLSIPDRIDVTVAAGADQDQGAAEIEVEAGVKVVAMLTPGHTAGQMNVIVPVLHANKTEKLLIWSGNDARKENTDLYASSAYFVEGFVVTSHATAWINTHGYQGAAFGHLRRMKANASYPNYFLMGEEGVRRWVGIFASCNRALAQRYRDGTWKSM
jgi:glyoxylase-like metal-dependent hydrolase (beta-lactamase superfamily II)